ncbi:TetR/AcrR family transcriptional regulator [Sungkyunkwania multivorans]|uniref:TetR/AcrR family transcriptional regulator n=1 Tax=Sungkyunkwania multivorans TaxID=1173618 RepID=A0ABW3D0A7_9FLAO
MPKIKTSKQEVLNTVIPVFRRKGIANSSMSELASECGIQKSHFYYYFESKDALVKAVLQEVNSYFGYHLEKISKDPKLSSEEIYSRIESLFEKVFLSDAKGCLMANTALEMSHTDPEYISEVKLFFTTFINGMTTMLQNRYRLPTAKDLAIQIVQDLEGGIILMQVFKDPQYLQNALARFKVILLGQDEAHLS